MPMEQLLRARRRAVGARQTTRALQKGQVKVVYLARDAEKHVTGPIAELCRDNRVEVIWVEQMRELGKACGIDVDCAAAAVLQE